MSKLINDGGSERQNWEAMVAMNAETKDMGLNTKLKVWRDDSKG